MYEDFSELISKMTDNARMVIQRADAFSRRYNSNHIGTEHLLLGIIAQDSSMGAKFLSDNRVTLKDVEDAINEPIKPFDVNYNNGQVKVLSEAAVLALKMSFNLARDYNQDYVGTEHILRSILSQKNSKAQTVLKTINVDSKVISEEIDRFFEKQESIVSSGNTRTTNRALKGRFLSKYGMNLTTLASKKELDPVIGRAKEIERVITVLCRRTKSNPVLIGEPGVGKTAIIEGLAQKIISSDVPEQLIGKHIIQVDLAGMISGTKFRGEFEERLKGLIEESENNPDTILFIDELHLLSGAGSAEGSMDAANILKPSLAKGKIKMIGATTFDEYRKYIEKDKALARRFQTVVVDEPSKDDVLQILKGLRPRYEKYHDVKISDEVLQDAINMSSRYINDRFMPDKVIDVIDEAAAIANVKHNKSGSSKIKKYLSERTRLNEKIEDSVSSEDYERAAHYKTSLAKIEAEIKKLQKKRTSDLSILKSEDLAKAISLKTGIPVSKVHGSEMKLLTNLESHLKKHIIGQDEAIKKVSKAIRRGRSGITNANRPMGSFIFMGPTGVGKTELARVLAREVFGGNDSLIKIDMSEFAEKHNVSRLVGAPAGYVGYDDGGKLTEAVRRRPYSVILFDEIEKAHPETFNILLQILEDGVLTDAQGGKIKFNNTIVILTSNLGSEAMYKESELGFEVKTKADKQDLKKEHEQNEAIALKSLSKVMKPELVNRFDSIVVFNTLSKKEIGRIFDGMIADLKTRLSAQDLGLIIQSSAKNHLVKRGYNAKSGARLLRREIEDELENLIAEGIIKNQFKKGSILSVSSDKNKLKLELNARE